MIDDIFHGLGLELVKILSNNKTREVHLGFIKDGVGVARGAWLCVYREGVSHGRLRKIETLPVEDKKELWETVKEMTGGEYSGDIVDVTRCYYTIDYYVKNHL